MLIAAAMMALAASVQTPVVIYPEIVYFKQKQDALTDTAKVTLDRAAESYRKAGGQVVLAGHTDRHGSDAANVKLSQMRAMGVRDYLIANGVPAAAITTQAFGESRPAVDTPDNVREAGNNRVEVTFGPGSGW